MKQTFNPDACMQLGEVIYLTSSTPIGVNARGLHFEYATYGITDEIDMNRFRHSVIDDLKHGITGGMFDGSPWLYVGADSCKEGKR